MAPPELLALLVALLLIIHLLTKNRKLSKRLPPGSLGIPIIGQSLGLLRAMRTNTGEEWIQKRINKYGPISKLSLFGLPAVFLTGPAANKFIFSSDSLAPKQTQSMSRIIGARNMLELTGKDHKRVRGAVSYFLKAEVLRKSLGKIDEEIRHHLRTNWLGHNQVKVMPSMKSLTFNIICSTLFGMERGARREVLVQEFTKVMAGLWSVPINLPFTNFNKSLKATRRIRKVLTKVLDEKRCALKRGECSSDEDLITYLLSLGADNGEALTEDEILDNAVLVMIGGYDTTSILLTFIARQLANDPAI
ncbi:hypothetical protein J5N97_027284 [Dioscorea zingiberensis]|uniref:Cytochrome P450 n=1 Tax=Dioscorea zingiberensis TaxID=325984 RepID=A0A9D5C3Q7_9LILI|nr:hypothetical protein J5N97_027284 [Dioscorea zingiberensis]